MYEWFIPYSAKMHFLFTKRLYRKGTRLGKLHHVRCKMHWCINYALTNVLILFCQIENTKQYYACFIANMVEMKISLFIFLLSFTMAVTLARTNIIEQKYKLSLHYCSYVDDILLQKLTTSLVACALECTLLEDCKAFIKNSTECELLSACPTRCNPPTVQSKDGKLFCLKGDTYFIHSFAYSLAKDHCLA